MTPGHRPALVIAGLHAELGGVPVLRNVDLTVAAGTTAALIGRNGAGKTTTMRCILGHVQARCDALLFGGRKLNGLSPHFRVRLGIGYAPEDRRLVGTLSVEDNILLPAHALRLDAMDRTYRLEQIYTLLPELQPLRARAADSLSGGQQKMVALGRALVIGSRLLLLDEPFQGLSPALARRYAEALAGLHERMPELAILVAESNPALVATLAQTRYTIERGAIVHSTDWNSHSPDRN